MAQLQTKLHLHHEDVYDPTGGGDIKLGWLDSLFTF